MSKKALKTYVKKMMYKHIPSYFMNLESFEKVIDSVCENSDMNRRETLMLAYSIGADVDETNTLLKINGHEPLYVKNYEDAVWRYFLSSNTDLMEIMEKVFE